METGTCFGPSWRETASWQTFPLLLLCLQRHCRTDAVNHHQDHQPGNPSHCCVEKVTTPSKSNTNPSAFSVRWNACLAQVNTVIGLYAKPPTTITQNWGCAATSTWTSDYTAMGTNPPSTSPINPLKRFLGANALCICSTTFMLARDARVTLLLRRFRF